MNHYCTYFDANYLTRGLALYRSLRAQDGEFSFTVLCMDEATETALRESRLPGVRLLSLAALAGRYPALTTARGNRTKLEFYFTCTSWLMRHVLAELPAGTLLTYLDADMYFFSTPAPVYAAIGPASVAITPHRFPPSLGHLERYGLFNVGWVSLRHDSTGLACAHQWAEQCAAWCYNRLEGERYADQKYLDAWPEQFPGTVSLDAAGVNAAPWNIRDALVARGSAGPQIDGAPLVFYHFHALTDLGRRLYDPGLHRYDAALSEPLRELVYLPYLRELHPEGAPAGDPPDLVPPSQSGDTRSGLALTHLLERLRTSELDRATRLESLERNRAAADRALAEANAATAQTIAYYKQVEKDRDDSQRALQAAHAATEKTIAYLKLVEADRDEARASLKQTVEYLQTVERDSAERLKSIEFYQGKLKDAYGDLERNVAYLKMLEAEIQKHVEVAADREALISQLTTQLQSPRPPGS